MDVKRHDGVLMVYSKDISDSLGLNCVVKEDNISFNQDNITLGMRYDSPYVFKDGYIMYVMEKPPAELATSKIYVPLSFVTDYLQAKVIIKKNNEYYINKGDLSLYDVVKFLPKEVLSAINDQNSPYRTKILKAVELSRSMNIEIPKINIMEKVMVTAPLATYTYNFKGDLIKHGHSEEEIANYAYEDYKAIERSWKLPEEMIQSTKSSYPELKDKDLSNWRYVDYEKYMTVADEKNFESSFSDEQKQQLKQRGILLEDTHYLKELYFNKLQTYSDDDLKKIIRSYYQFSIDWLKANSKYEKLEK